MLSKVFILSGSTMKQQEIPIVHSTYELYRYLHSLSSSVPKLERHTLWARIENVLLSCLEMLVFTAYLDFAKRLAHLNQIAGRLDLLRLLIRLSFDIKAIDHKKYILAQQKLDEIGKMLGGWIKAVKKATTGQSTETSS